MHNDNMYIVHQGSSQDFLGGATIESKKQGSGTLMNMHIQSERFNYF